MKVLFIASEAAPLAKVGGLGDVAISLPRALRAMGHDIRVLIPQYKSIDTRQFPLIPEKSGLHFSLPGESHTVNLNRTESSGVPIYTLENQKYFWTEEIYANDLERFFFFSQAVFKVLPEMEWQPEIIHCHDWLTALVVMLARKAGYPYSTVFTIHNLAYQGFFDEDFMDRHNLRKYWEDYPPEAPRPPHCFLSQAILWADLLTTVSETYAREITTPEYGAGLEELLKYRLNSLTGIINGIDYDYWNPQTDGYLPVNFNPEGMKKRALNKVALQRVTGLPVDNEIPVIGMIQRLDEQKGLDILKGGIDQILGESGVQLVILGRGQPHYEEMVRQIVRQYPAQAAAFNAFEEPLAHLIYGGSDMFLMPSRFEPCGLGQMIAMRYGAIPIVRHTGGLVDTVPPLNADLSEGSGFVFHDYSSQALAAAVREAAEAFKDKKAWQRAMQRVSRIDFSWNSSARRYEKVYELVLEKTGKR